MACSNPMFVFHTSAWRFEDCKSYIMAQEGGTEPDDILHGNLIRACQSLTPGHPPPHHIYSHITVMWLDAILDKVDAAAMQAAQDCPDTIVWVVPRQQPCICFSQARVQVHPRQLCTSTPPATPSSGRG